jgi:aryl-alcohol dehydrogenase-like predicted oxidoreductase
MSELFGRLISRRDALKVGLGVGAGLALGRLPLGASPSNAPRLGDGLYAKPIPSTGEEIPIIGIGTARRYDVGSDESDRAPLREVLRALPELGGTLVDTAPSYGNAETVIGDLMAELGNRDQIFLATKVRQEDPADALAEIEGSFERLRTDRFDLLMVHNLVGIGHKLPVLREMKREGRIRYLGMSTSFEGQYDDFVSVMETEDMDFIQVDYAIDNREAEERILPLAADRGMAVLTNLPFGRGRVFEALGDQEIPDWAGEFGIESWAQFALMFAASHPAVTCAIPGTATLEYLEDNLGTARTARLPDQETRRRMASLIDSA